MADLVSFLRTAVETAAEPCPGPKSLTEVFLRPTFLQLDTQLTLYYPKAAQDI